MTRRNRRRDGRILATEETRRDLAAHGVELPGDPRLPGVEIVTQDEAEKVDFVVCVLASEPAPFADNLTAPCGLGCGRTVQFRPHAPKAPPKVCIACALQVANAKRH